MATYLPSSAINASYRYTISNGHYVVRTNQNCYTNYNTTYCDCYDIYPELDYITSETYTCAYTGTNFLNYTNFSSDLWYRSDLNKILVIFFILFFFIILFPYKIISRLFGRWLKI